MVQLVHPLFRRVCANIVRSGATGKIVAKKVRVNDAWVLEASVDLGYTI